MKPSLFVIFLLFANTVLATNDPYRPKGFDYAKLASQPNGCGLVLGLMSNDLRLAYFKTAPGPEVERPDMRKVDLLRGKEHLSQLARRIVSGAYSELHDYLRKSTLATDLDLELEFAKTHIHRDWRYYLSDRTLSIEDRFDVISRNTSYFPYITYVMRTSFPAQFKLPPGGNNKVILPDEITVESFSSESPVPFSEFRTGDARRKLEFEFAIGISVEEFEYFEKLMAFATWEEIYHHVDFVHWLRTGESLSPTMNRFLRAADVAYDYFVHSELTVIVAARYEYELLQSPQLFERVRDRQYPNYPIRYLRQLVDHPAMRAAAAN